MESKQVTILAGRGKPSVVDGIGTAASFYAPQAICYSAASGGGSLLIAEKVSSQIRCVNPATQHQKFTLNRLLTSALMESGGLTIQALILIIVDFAQSQSTYTYCVLSRMCCFVSRYRMGWGFRSLTAFVVLVQMK